MQAQRHGHGRRVAWQPASALLACGVAALPKCPFCLLALAAVLGIESVPLVEWVPRVFPVILVAAVLPLASGATDRRAAGPLLVGLAAASLLFAGWAGLVSTWWMRAAAAGLVLASLWRAARGGTCHGHACPTDDSERQHRF